MTNYYGYARVSTKDQSDHSLENQIKYLEIKAQELGLNFIPYKEKESGKSISNRQELQKLLSQVERGDYVGFYDNSRLGRDTKESLEIVDTLIEKGVKVQISGDSFDKDSPRQRLLYIIESAVSEFYRRDQYLKSQIGIEQKKRSGEWIFSSFLLGYRLSYQNGQPKVDVVEEEAELIRYIFKEYARGKSIRKITIDINARGYTTRKGKLFVAATVRRYIHKPIYKGYYKVEGAGGQKGQEKKGYNESELVRSKYYPPIVDEELWDKVQNSYRSLHRKHTIQFEYRYSYYELTSIIKCYYCKHFGKPTTYVHSFQKFKNRTKAYTSYVNRAHWKGCQQKFHTLRAWVFELLFQTCFYLVFANLNEIGDFIAERRADLDIGNDQIKDDINRIDKRLSDINKEIENLLDVIQHGVDAKDRIYQRINNLTVQQNELKSNRSELEDSIWDIEEEFDLLVEEYSDKKLLKFVKAKNPSVRREIYKEMIERAYIYNKQLIIRYTNSKLFIIPLIRNKGCKIQQKFRIKVFFMNKYQYTIFFDAEENIYYIYDLSSTSKGKTDRQKKMANSISISIEKEIKELKEKIEDFKSVVVSDNETEL